MQSANRIANIFRLSVVCARYVRDGLGHNVTEYAIEPLLQTCGNLHAEKSCGLSFSKTMRNGESLSEAHSAEY